LRYCCSGEFLNIQGENCRLLKPKSQQPIVINSYKVIFDSYFSIRLYGAKGSEKCRE
jgi:hypothetical protein